MKEKLFKTIRFPDGTTKKINKCGVAISVKGKKVTVIPASPTKSEECKCTKSWREKLGWIQIWESYCPIHGQKQDQPAEWEEEFDDYWFISKKRTRGSTNAHRYEVKAFIKVLLSSQKQNLIQEVEKKHDEIIDILTLKHGGVSDIQSWAQGYDRAISDVLSFLKGDDEHE